ncbi:MAG: cyclase family protein [Deltaproteobacteria bacterium]|nr:cyclase family protein [Deltaproteobacteria bacterium]
MRFIDLSTTIAPGPDLEITYRDHAEGAKAIESLFNVSSDLLRHGEGWAVEEFTRFSTHGSTHIDAPWHYNSQIKGQPAQTVDKLPLEWFFSDGVVLEMRHKAEGDPVTVDEVQQELDRINYTLKPLDIVLVRTGRDKFYGQPDYMFKGCGVTAEATRWLYDQGVRVMGIDSWGWDCPLNLQAEKAVSEQEKGIFWAAHQADVPYSQIERLVNLDPLPSCGFKVACFPLKIEGGSAAPARVVAILPD